MADDRKQVWIDKDVYISLKIEAAKRDRLISEVINPILHGVVQNPDLLERLITAQPMSPLFSTEFSPS